MKYYRIRKIDADQTFLSDHRTLNAARRAFARYERQGMLVLCYFVHADGSRSTPMSHREMFPTLRLTLAGSEQSQLRR